MREEEETEKQQEGDRYLVGMPGEEEIAQLLSPDLVHEDEQSASEEQRENLYQKILKLSTPQKIRLAILGNREARNFLIHSPNKTVSLAVLKNPQVTENEVVKYAQQKNLPEEIILAIAKNQKWMKNYPIKLAIISNPKTPLSVAVNFLIHLHDHDLRSLSRDKSVSAVLSRTAHQIHQKRKSLK
jgi:hypothetical protein